MRHYNTDSPEAVGRLLALAALADGQVSGAELAALEAAAPEIGSMTGVEMRRVLRTLCEDLLMDDRPYWQGMAAFDSNVLKMLFDEVQDPALRMHALRLGLRVARADDHLHDAESQLLLDAMSHWGLLEPEASGRPQQRA
ncbi:TerB family tellurite resistance protein [Roseateles cellulosilyticus]|uniref:TerB family tellurite resistance protein n=1 Tax=Pelomonas cellulosilytica TaxID=2906762 RepID=A0ABS8XX56_9BURK|nr:TerB family tellurite resistance protein [Pelomonas sp. P8]MCE4557246.1 TerB family tellurite resistance protein [Pelomonas sp. P8]